MHQITKRMLSDALYSVNKRAKNYRDDKRRGIENAAEMERAMYDRKTILLSLLDPVYVHREPLYETEQVDQKNPAFFDKLLQAVLDDTIIWWSDYYKKNNELVHFFLIKKELIGYQYYLFYPFMEHSYHQPISEEDLVYYSDLPIRDIQNLATTGDTNVIPLEEVDEMIQWILDDDYVFDGYITEKDIERHWNSKEFSYEAEHRIDEAYNFLNHYLIRKILQSGKPQSLSDEDKDAIELNMRDALYTLFYSCDTQDQMEEKLKRYRYYLEFPKIETELIYNAPDSYTTSMDKLIYYWDKKGCFVHQQELYKKRKKALRFASENKNRIGQEMMEMVLEDKEEEF